MENFARDPSAAMLISFACFMAYLTNDFRVKFLQKRLNADFADVLHDARRDVEVCQPTYALCEQKSLKSLRTSNLLQLAEVLFR